MKEDIIKARQAQKELWMLRNPKDSPFQKSVSLKGDSAIMEEIGKSHDEIQRLTAIIDYLKNLIAETQISEDRTRILEELEGKIDSLYEFFIEQIILKAEKFNEDRENGNKNDRISWVFYC